jgi:hypothetical protein
MEEAIGRAVLHLPRQGRSEFVAGASWRHGGGADDMSDKGYADIISSVYLRFQLRIY